MVISEKEGKSILCVFTRILGWSVFIQYIYEALDKIPRFNTTRIEYGNNDVYKLVPPKYCVLSNDFDAIWRMNEYAKIKGINDLRYDGMIFQGYQLAVPFRKKIKLLPTVLITDTTPALADVGNEKVDGVIKKIIKSIYMPIMHLFVYQPLFSSIDCFFVLSERVRKSLIESYNISEDKIHNINPPLFGRNSSLFEQEIPKTEKPRLLFVGNDFKRKGGDFLLELYEKSLYEIADLIIVSNDKLLDNIDLPSGVKLYRNVPHDQILDIFKQCDLFLFPTFKDELGLVLSEAVSAGLPIVARDATSQDEYVTTGFNGELLSYDSGENEWEEAIVTILSDPLLIKKYKENSLILAEKKLSREVFKSTIDNALKSIGL